VISLGSVAITNAEIAAMDTSSNANLLGEVVLDDVMTRP
jgi:hypothetical protein